MDRVKKITSVLLLLALFIMPLQVTADESAMPENNIEYTQLAGEETPAEPEEETQRAELAQPTVQGASYDGDDESPVGTLVTSETQLHDLLRTAVDGDKIRLGADIALHAPIKIEVLVHIYGDGHTLSLADGYTGRHIEIADGLTEYSVYPISYYLYIENITFDGMGHGGGMHLGAGAMMNIEGSIFTRCRAERGGALYAAGEGAGFGITNSLFKGNSATLSGGAMYGEEYAYISIDNTVFEYNSSVDGGAIYLGGSNHLNFSMYEDDRSPFANNTATGNGGAIYMNEGTFYFRTDSQPVIENNAAKNGGFLFIQMDEVCIVDFMARDIGPSTITLQNNRAEQDGGAICIRTENEEASCQNLFAFIDFNNNTAGRNGGAICVPYGYGWNTLELDDINFYYNTAQHSGGAVYFDQLEGEAEDFVPTRLRWAKFVGNRAVTGDGGAIWVRNPLTLYIHADISFSSSRASRGFYLTDPDIIEVYDEYVEDGVTPSGPFEYVFNNYDIAYVLGEQYEYTVTFETYGGTEFGCAYVVPGEKLEDPGKPAKAGYEFQNWFTDMEFTEEWCFIEGNVEGDMTLHAAWALEDVSGPELSGGTEKPGDNGGDTGDTPGGNGVNTGVVTAVSALLLAVGVSGTAMSVKRREQ